MYGMINRAVKDLVLQDHGQEVWTRVCTEAGLESDEFGSMEQYPDETTYSLVGACSRILGASAEEILIAFGRHWITYTSRSGYGELLTATGSSLGECLGNLDQLHTRISLGMPHLNPPSFRVEEDGEGGLLLHYISDREGLAPLVIGLVEGLAERFEERVEIIHDEGRTRAQDHDVFRIEKVA